VGDGWAWISLSAYNEDLAAADIAALLPGAVESRRNSHLAAVRFKGHDDRARLGELLSELTSYLASHRHEIQDLLPGSDWQLRIGWSPLSPQESLVISAQLLAYLAELRVDLMLDGYDAGDGVDFPEDGRGGGAGE
jgi:hypothetical protein